MGKFPNKTSCEGQCPKPCSNGNLEAAECAAWQNFFDYTGGAHWEFCSDKRDDPCGCEKVTCHIQGIGSIITVYLPGNNLTGTVPSSLGKLTALTALHLDRNNLTGTVPSTLGQLADLTSLQLDSNSLTGTIPSTLGQLSYLRALQLDHNHLTGPMPALPFRQYTNYIRGEEGACCLTRDDYAPRTNNFACPLPAGAADCKCAGDPGVVCSKAK
jgi:hypothetical protein